MTTEEKEDNTALNTDKQKAYISNRSSGTNGNEYTLQVKGMARQTVITMKLEAD